MQSLNLLMLGIVASAGIFLAMAMSYMVQQVKQVDQDWTNYQVVRSDKARLESVLRASIGYGGMIHHFKNYVLRNENQLMLLAQENIGAALAAIKQYKVLNLDEAEKLALGDIEQTIIEYNQLLVHAQNLIKSGESSPEMIDQQIKVDDSRALRGLATLRGEVIKDTGYEQNSLVKGRVAADIRAYLGYGGMIHHFKNLVLRHDTLLVNEVFNDIQKIKQSIAVYRKLSPTVAELIALDDIDQVLHSYEQKLTLVEQLINEGENVSSIDQTVKVDDKLALRGLNSLDREIAFQIQTLSIGVGDKLHFVATVSTGLSALMLLLILIVFIFSSWLFNKHVIRPVTRINRTMDRLAEGETNLEIHDTDLENEIGSMARALVTFKKYIVYKQEAVEAANHIASTDGLTGLDNRKRFEKRLTESINMAKRSGTTVACLMIDLDKFKAVNDTYGHGAGDEVLKAVADRLRSVCRETDFPARLGGDEFAVLLTVLDDLNYAEIPAKRIIDQLKLPIYFEDKIFEIGGSIGIAGFPQDSEDPVELVKYADRALYAAKDAGRGTFCFFDSEKLSEIAK